MRYCATKELGIWQEWQQVGSTVSIIGAVNVGRHPEGRQSLPPIVHISKPGVYSLAERRHSHFITSMDKRIPVVFFLKKKKVGNFSRLSFFHSFCLMDLTPFFILKEMK